MYARMNERTNARTHAMLSVIGLRLLGLVDSLVDWLVIDCLVGCLVAVCLSIFVLGNAVACCTEESMSFLLVIG